MLIIVEVIHVEHKLHLLVEMRAINPQKARHKLSRVKVAVTVNIKNSKETFGEQSRQLTVVEEANLVDAFSLIITATAQILVDVLEVGQADLHLEVTCLCGLGESQRLCIVNHRDIYFNYDWFTLL